MKIPADHPRFESLQTREKLVEGLRESIVVPQGLMAHGRGEAFDYIMGERTLKSAKKAIRTAAAQLLLANHPVISVNGNVAALVPREISQLARSVPAGVEVNLFHRTRDRESRIAATLTRNGVSHVLGLGANASARISGISSRRKMVDPSGIASADVVFVPLEDGDRVAALKTQGRIVIAVDLNPLSRTSLAASITIVDNVVRAFPRLVREVRVLKPLNRTRLERIVESFDNRRNLNLATKQIISYLRGWSRS